MVEKGIVWILLQHKEVALFARKLTSFSKRYNDYLTPVMFELCHLIIDSKKEVDNTSLPHRSYP